MLAKYSKNDEFLQFDTATANNFDSTTKRSAESILMECLLTANILAKDSRVMSVNYTNSNIPGTAAARVKSMIPYKLYMGHTHVTTNIPYACFTENEYIAVRNPAQDRTIIVEYYSYKIALIIINESGTYYKYILSDSLTTTNGTHCTAIENATHISALMGCVLISARVTTTGSIAVNETMLKINGSIKANSQPYPLYCIDQNSKTIYNVYGYWDSTNGLYIYSDGTIPSGITLCIIGTITPDYTS